MLLLGVMLGLTAMVWAASPAPQAQALSLRDSLSLALARNLAIRLAERDLQTAESERDQAFAEFLPKFSALVDYTHKSEAPTLELPPELLTLVPGLAVPSSATKISLGGQDTSTLKVRLQQPLFTGFAVSNTYRRATVSLDIARSRLQTAQHAVAFDVVRAYLAVLRAQKAADLSAQQVKALEAQAAQSQAFFEGGVIPKNDLLKAEVELANARQTLIRAQNQAELARASLNHALGQDLNTPLQLEEVQAPPPSTIAAEAALERAWERRPEIRELTATIEAARLGVSVAQSQFFPQLSLVGTYTVDITGGNPSLPPKRWEVGGVLQWNAFEGGKARAQAREARIAQQKASEALQQLRERIALEVKQAVLDVQEAAQKIRVAEAAIAQAAEHFRIAQERYLAQITTSAEVIDAEALLTQANTNYFNAVYDYHLASYALKQATGTILE
jgi:outer membrane protein